jgi:2-methylisocitrate lyase-like PEP mutase family enzyme
VSTELAAKADQLRALHDTGVPLVLANVWDARSARIVVKAGFAAVATSSGAVVTTLGYRDGGHAPPDVVFAALARITGAVEVPVTADIEDGYGLSADDLADALVGSGAAGCNLEDSDHAGVGLLVDADQFATRVVDLKRAARGRGVDLVVNARVDVHLQQVGPPEGRLGEALRRARLYVEAGADCIYPITVSDEETAKALVAGAGSPINLLARAEAADVVRLASYGATRISVGSGLATLAYQRAEEVARQLATAL